MNAPSSLSSLQYKDVSFKIHESSLEKRRVVKAQLELTYRCNLHCLHCYTDPYNKKAYFPREMSLEEILRLLDEMAELGILWLTLTGGEIFMRKDFFQIYETAYEKGFLLALFTNGTVFTGEMIGRLKERPPFLIDISCHSVDENAFDRFTQVPGSFQRFRQGIELLRASGLEFALKTKAMTWNKDEIPRIREFVESLGKEFGFTTALHPRLDGDTSSLRLRLAAGEIKALETTEKVWIEDEESCRISRDWLSEPPEELYRCGCATNAVHINAWGELGACTFEYESRASLREYSLSAAIEKVFAGVRALRYRKKTPCARCELHTFCEKTPTTARWEVQDPEEPVPWHCDTALDRAERLTQKKLNHPLTPTKENP